jgi:hypothetical protein
MKDQGEQVSDQSSSFFGDGKKKKKDIRKKKFLNSVCRNVGRRSLGICCQTFYRVFARSVIHTVQFRWKSVSRYMQCIPECLQHVDVLSYYLI